MRIVIDRDRCEANGICVQQAPEVFRLDQEDTLQLVDDAPADRLRPVIEAAVRLCPRNALSIAPKTESR
jgi:ferredoxin